MSNILNHNRNIFDFKINKSDYWDFHLCIDNTANTSYINSDCLAVDIDANDNECVWFDSLYSKPFSTWKESVNNGLELNSIGFTGVDNGLLSYDKDKITNKEFLNIFLNSKYTIDKDDKRLMLNKVKGNNQIYDYECNLTYYNDVQVIKLNGGFYQGFFKSYDYQVLPTDLNNGIGFSFTLKKENFINTHLTLNDKHPNNKGFFFYVGTRAENKWWKKYLTIFNEEQCPQTYIAEEYVKDYIQDSVLENTHYVSKNNVDETDRYFDENYIVDGKESQYYDENAVCNVNYVEDDYFEPDTPIDINTKLTTAEGYDLYQPNIIEFKTDNKFITYNHTKDGFTVKDDIEDKEVVLYDIKTPKIENYFLLFNHTCNGYTTKNIQTLIDKENKRYDILSDLYNNALGFRITDNGEIGYRYLIRDCENNSYKIEEEYSKPYIITDKWCNVYIQIVPSGQQIKFQIYVNNKIVLISKSLPKIKLRELNDLQSKQEGVPFNISLGGGTQGLCDVINMDYNNLPDTILPIEKNFAGSFIGYIKSFKIYNCIFNYDILSKNIKTENDLINQNDIYNI